MSARVPVGGAAADFLVAADSAVVLLGGVEVVQRWSDPSALPGMTVGALAAHLGSQVLHVHAAVTAGTGVADGRPVTLLEHYARVPWVEAGFDDASNVAIREGAEHSAGIGHDALVLSVQQAVDDLRTAFTRNLPSGLPPAIRMAHWDWSVSFEDFLVTRVMEIVVHSDDLAVSVDVAPPRLPDPVLGPVLALLVGISLRRHGQAALVRTLSRSERAPRSVSAFE
jgi:hypothetical protein